MIVSHDVHFIDEVAKEVWELSDHMLTKHGGNYQDFLQHKATENEARERRLSESRQEIVRAKKALAKENIHISRRTVTKYREQLLIPCASKRKSKQN